jgi:hypothetical protein
VNDASLRFLLDESFGETNVVSNVCHSAFIWTRTDRDLCVRVAPMAARPAFEVSTNVTIYKERR